MQKEAARRDTLLGHQIDGVRQGIDVADPTPAAESVSLRREVVDDTLTSITSAKESLAMELLGQVNWVLMRQGTARGARTRFLALDADDAVAGYSAPKALAA